MRKTPRRCRRMRSTPPITPHTRPRPCASRDSCARLHDPLCRYAKVSSVALRNRVQRRRRMKKRDHRHRHASSREDAAVAATSSDTRAGLIISNYGATLQVEDDDGAIHRSTARKKIEALECGDREEWLATQNDEGVIVINKSDLFTTAGRAEAERIAAVYLTIGYRVLFTAAKIGEGLAPLIAALRHKVSVISGQSGVGKSSLAKSLHPKGDIKVGEVTAGSGAGRHTTTMAALYHLEGGGDLIDSPGVRDFALWKVTTAELARGFVEFGPHADHCRFGDCSHTGEPGCAVELAAKQGDIQPRRLANYRRIAAAMRT